MDEASVESLRREVAQLEAEEAQLSAVRDRLQHQIDFGFENESTRTREREVSDERRRLHDRIDALKQRLRAAQTV